MFTRQVKQILILNFVLSFLLASFCFGATDESKDVKNPSIQEKNKKCVLCHLKENKSLVLQWENSIHASSKDGSVGCYTCHATKEGDPYGYKHEGAFIKTLMTPKDCAYCHQRETKEMMTSHHATAGEILASADNVLGEVVCSMPDTKADAVNGCWQCHGGIVKLQKDKDGKTLLNQTGAVKIDYTTWPNSGIGRLNPDGTKGTCNACHSKHSFKASIARQPQNCAKCHLGPDHPQKEIYEESKHGIAYFSTTRGSGMNGMDILKTGTWVLGKDYHFAPTCSTCHMGAYLKINGSVAQNTHNVGDRISWTLRPPISVKLNRVIFNDGTFADIPGEYPPQVGQTVKDDDYVVENEKMKKVVKDKKIVEVVSWKERRKTMQGVCKSCHSVQKVENFYTYFDDFVYTYNDKFAKPTKELWDMMQKDGLVKGSLFHSDAGWAWWEIWHHEGRRARHGAAMMGPDYAHWHGLYDVAHKFYFEYLPEVINIAKEHGQLEKYKKAVDALLNKPEHKWRLQGFGEQIEKMIKDEQKSRYGQ